MNTHPTTRGRIFRTAFLILTMSALPFPAFGYGDDGHKTVGAIADILIANSPNTVAHVKALIGNKTLEKSATWADDCKYHFNPQDPDMVAFVAANPHLTPTPGPHDQNAYHYTDIPIQETHYRANSAGASNIDVVRMIRNCIAILEGHSNATNNPTGIPPQTALRLLVHYVGDIHQPLHVGAAYFGPGAQLVNPNNTAGGKEDHGGNAINFKDLKLNKATNLHSYWDTPTVRDAMSAANASTPRVFAQKIIANPPQGWENGPFMSGWSVKWADEMLPIARSAHDQLTFKTNAKSWSATRKDPATYDQWASTQVRTEISRAGYRLAAILKKIWP
jgi:hypothetical protein